MGTPRWEDPFSFTKPKNPQRAKVEGRNRCCAAVSKGLRPCCRARWRRPNRRRSGRRASRPWGRRTRPAPGTPARSARTVGGSPPPPETKETTVGRALAFLAHWPPPRGSWRRKKNNPDPFTSFGTWFVRWQERVKIWFYFGVKGKKKRELLKAECFWIAIFCSN